MIALQQMCVLFAMMLIGYIAFRAGYLTEPVSVKLSSIVVNIANPALILTSVSDFKNVQTADLTVAAAAAAVTYALLILTSCFIPDLLRVKKSDRPSYRLMCVFNNVGFMGLPIIQTMYGKQALLFAAVFIFFYNILIYTFGVKILRADGDLVVFLRDILNPGVIACLAALLIMLCRIKIPTLGASIFTMCGNLTAPLSMMCIGASFGCFRFRELFCKWKLILFSLLKLLVIPALGILLMRPLIQNRLILDIALIVLATPVGSMTTMLAQQYGADYQVTSQGIALSTVLSIVTIPLIMTFWG
ncbi:MAG: AEC family transporter [Oscillospiraceae bacterium]|nr:AEC family transporter [Oscillospiraceae bacterium]MCI1990570.1 AEC family transporter [Oscillospiraceae bacterium]